MKRYLWRASEAALKENQKDSSDTMMCDENTIDDVKKVTIRDTNCSDLCDIILGSRQPGVHNKGNQ